MLLFTHAFESRVGVKKHEMLFHEVVRYFEETINIDNLYRFCKK